MGRQYNSTIRLKQKTCISCGKPCVWFSRQRCQECARIEDTLAKDNKAVDHVEDLRGLIDDADVLISRYVRLSAADENGMVVCYTCGEPNHWRVVDAGHYIPRANLFLRHDLRNIKPQCHTCNRAKYGKAAAFAVHLEKDEPGLPQRLLDESRIVYHITREDLRATISDMTEKLSKIKNDCNRSTDRSL